MNSHYWIFVIVLFIFINAEIDRKSYELKNEIVHLEGGNTLDFILIIDPDRNSSLLETEIQESTDICCLRIREDAHFQINYVPEVGNIIYPQIIVRFYLRKPPQTITLHGQAKLKVIHRLKVDNMTIRLNDYSYAEIDIIVLSNLSVYIRNTAKLVLTGLVMDTAHIFVSHAGELDALSCRMNRFISHISEFGVAYVKNERSSTIRIITRWGKIRPAITYANVPKLFDFNKIQKCMIDNSSEKQNISFLLLFICLFVLIH